MTSRAQSGDVLESIETAETGLIFVTRYGLRSGELVKTLVDH